MADDKKDTREEAREKSRIRQLYNKRITTAKYGREAFAANDYLNALKNYHSYLKTLGEVHDRDVYTLTTDLFDKDKDVTEMLLISQIYWDMSRIYEKNEQMAANFQKCLNQFVRFTANQPYQVVNAEMLRKYIKKSKGRSTKVQALEKAYSQIFVQSRKCYIATHCFSEEETQLTTLREFKNTLLTFSGGQKFVELYYRGSSRLVPLLQKNQNQFLVKIFNTAMKSFLKVFSRIIN
jgi:hypothetical protein